MPEHGDGGAAIARRRARRRRYPSRREDLRYPSVERVRTAARAAMDVGYESASRFGREFKRLFGLSPAQEVKRMRAGFAMPARHDTAFLSSH